MKVYVMSGLPGSGKSTLARKLAGENGLVLSADDYFMVDGEYRFDPTKIGEAHKRCMDRFIQATQAGEPLIVVDNTNLSKWEISPYMLVGETMVYEVTVVVVEEDNPTVCAARTTHGVPLEVIKKMAYYREDLLPWWNAISSNNL